ncbi:hypothetical protein I6F07_07000 [Ensifer sp. IC4062]|nr:hypothetical protein [Ensifer sp. IC4062]MCA1439975.1 hypothetical protein [Ensifer sp. IC4062]
MKTPFHLLLLSQNTTTLRIPHGQWHRIGVAAALGGGQQYEDVIATAGSGHLQSLWLPSAAALSDRSHMQ